jgi:hypothetical protein
MNILLLLLGLFISNGTFTTTENETNGETTTTANNGDTRNGGNNDADFIISGDIFP